MFNTAIEQIKQAANIVVIQAENPDGDSLGSALALEEILSDIGKSVSLHCPVDIPKYLRYLKGWDRVTQDFDTKKHDLAIIVDINAEVLITKTMERPGVRAFLETHPVVVIDHHATNSDLTFDSTQVVDTAVATSQIILEMSETAQWGVNPQAAENMLAALLSDSLGLTTQNVDASSYYTAGKLTVLGASTHAIESRRREFMKKSQGILAYKGKLIERIEYELDGKLALIHIPWEEIQSYSDQYNPSVLVLDEMRLVEGVEIGVAIKTYPDGKLTGKLRSNLPISADIAGYFGGGGHEYAAGFRTYESYDTIVQELRNITEKAIRYYDTQSI